MKPGFDGSLAPRLALARRILDVQYFQPATALWRLFEAEVVIAHLQGHGRGLDLGCGDGALATILFARTPEIRWTGLDIEPRDAALARARNIYERVHVASAEAIPEPDASFDLVFANSALEHMAGLDAVLSEVHRVLRPQGKFILTVPVEEFRDLLFWPRLLRGLGFQKTAERYTDHLDRRIAHLNYLSPAAWRRRLSRHGFESRLEVPYLSPRLIAWWESLANATGGLAYLMLGKRKTLRQIQHASGVLERQRRSLATLVFLGLLPALLVTSLERSPAHHGCLYLEATRLG